MTRFSGRGYGQYFSGQAGHHSIQVNEPRRNRGISVAGPGQILAKSPHLSRQIPDVPVPQVQGGSVQWTGYGRKHTQFHWNDRKTTLGLAPQMTWEKRSGTKQSPDYVGALVILGP